MSCLNVKLYVRSCYVKILSEQALDGWMKRLTYRGTDGKMDGQGSYRQA